MDSPTEASPSTSQTFYGCSFVTDHLGAILQSASRNREEILVQAYNLDAIQTARRSWGLFRDRRPELYRGLTSYDGYHKK